MSSPSFSSLKTDWSDQHSIASGKSKPRLALGWQALIALMVNLLSLALPVMMLQVYDRIIPHQAYGTLSLLITGVLAALLCDALLRLVRAYLAGWTAAAQEHRSGCAAIRRFAQIDMNAFGKNSTGNYLQNMAALGRLREFYSGQSLMALVDLPFALIFLGLIWYLGGWLVLVPVTLLCLFIVFAGRIGQELKATIEDRSGKDDRKASFMVSVLSSVHSVKALAMESMLVRRFEVQQAATTTGSYRVALASGVSTTLSAVFGQASLILTATIGSIFVMQGYLSVGGLSACTLLAGRTIQPVQRVLGAWLRMQDLAVSRHQAETLFKMPLQARDDSAMALPHPEGRIALENIRFGYDNAEILFDNITLEANPGDVIAINGGKGSGKSTLLQLMAGMLEPVSGTVEVDGIQPARYSLGDLSAHIGYLPQQGAIFKGSILENITGFRQDDESVAKAKQAGRSLGLDEVVNLLPRGYQTMLLDNAADPVPPGVKQRIALARILMHEPALLLFDDADRTLDKEGYNRLFRVMGKLKGNCTLVIVSHDQNLLSFADRFYHLENGRLKATTINNVQQLAFLAQASPEQ